MALGTEMLGAFINTLVFYRGRGERKREVRVG